MVYSLGGRGIRLLAERTYTDTYTDLHPQCRSSGKSVYENSRNKEKRSRKKGNQVERGGMFYNMFHKGYFYVQIESKLEGRSVLSIVWEIKNID